MSLIGKKPISLPKEVKADFSLGVLTISGPKGELKKPMPQYIDIKIAQDMLSVEVKEKTRQALISHGTQRSHIANMVAGVSDGWTKTLELVGTGYRAETTGKLLTMQAGYSHPIKFEAPEGIVFKVEKNDIIVSGTDREVVGQICARIKAVRPPDPYKGKGVKYKGEIIRRKAGKAAKAAGAA